jgi:hypothetical protein
LQLKHVNSGSSLIIRVDWALSHPQLLWVLNQNVSMYYRSKIGKAEGPASSVQKNIINRNGEHAPQRTKLAI